ncbi:MAG: DUF5103 domain-containing protein, partial [Bacteroidota bacterium]
MSYGQIEGIAYEDKIYADDIHTVTFHLTGFPLTQPIIDLGATSTLSLSFDDLGDDLRNIYYTIIHCNADWTPSVLSPLEYIEGFDENLLEVYNFSSNTLTEFTNYQLQLPNDQLSWTKSGNYVLVVYENEGEKVPLFTRRFMVSDPLVRIHPTLTRPVDVEKARTVQELDFTVFYEELSVRDPMREIKATVMQNARWDNAIEGIPPFAMYSDKVVYDYQDKITFPAGKEYRFVDIRSLLSKSEGILAIEEFDDVYEVTLRPVPVRAFRPYLFFKDINGHFYIENSFEPREIADIRSDYAWVVFSLEKNMPFEDGDIYLFGKMTDWQIQEKFKLSYSEKLGMYATEIFLKQGFYN